MRSEGEGNRGYCMAARRYEISLPVFQHEKEERSVKGAIYYVAIATAKFSHLTCEDIKFSRQSSPSISLVFI